MGVPEMINYRSSLGFGHALFVGIFTSVIFDTLPIPFNKNVEATAIKT
jgi:hypothetical protein